MEKVRKITISIEPVEGSKDKDGRQEFVLEMSVETCDKSQPKKSEVIWLLEEAIEFAKKA